MRDATIKRQHDNAFNKVNDIRNAKIAEQARQEAELKAVQERMR
jgi:hypothetical protein